VSRIAIGLLRHRSYAVIPDGISQRFRVTAQAF
jgi:hypothetical protein